MERQGINLENAEQILELRLQKWGWNDYARQKEDLRLRLEQEKQGIYFNYQKIQHNNS